MREASGPGAASAPAAIPTVAAAMWAQREVLKQNRAEIVELLDAVGRPEQFSLVQAIALLALSLEFRPDLILELGRGHGNSTAVSTAAAHLLGPQTCHVTSLCLTSFWQLDTAPRIRRVRGDAWFEPLTAARADIRSFDYQPLLSTHSRVLIFWDAHGYDIAECVLGGILPLLAGKAAYVLMHDISDARYLDPAELAYGDRGLWRGNDWSGRYIRLGDLFSNVEQTVAIVDFASRNRLELRSLTHDLRTVLSADEIQELDQGVGLGLATADIGMYGFSQIEGRGDWTYPAFRKPNFFARLWTDIQIGSFFLARRLWLETPGRRLVRIIRRLRHG